MHYRMTQHTSNLTEITHSSNLNQINLVEIWDLTINYYPRLHFDD